MKKSFLIHICLMPVLFMLGYSTSLNSMYTQDDELREAIEMSIEAYKPELQSREQEQSCEEKLQQESRALEQFRMQKLLYVKNLPIKKILITSKDEFNQEQQLHHVMELEEQKVIDKPKIYKMTEQELIDKFNANAVVVVNNVNVPVESMDLKEFMGNIRKAVARSEIGALWDVPINTYKNPCLFSIIAHEKRYLWNVLFKKYSLELGLIEENTCQGLLLKLFQICESGPTLKYPRNFTESNLIKPFNIVSLK